MLKTNKKPNTVISKSFFKINKNFNINKKINHAAILYVQNRKSNLKCIENLESYNFSKNSNIIIISDDDLKLSNMFGLVKIKKIPKLRNSNDYSSFIFLNALQLATEIKLDYFFYYEWDCKVGKDFWYDTLWEEHLDWSDPLMTGTPVVKVSMKNPIGNFLCGIETYRHQYAKKCGVAMSVYNCGGLVESSVHTNGALGFYKTSEIKKIFYKSIKEVSPSTIRKISPWDNFLGTKFYKKYKSKCFNRIGWLPSSYSGCGDEFYCQKQRNFMLDSGLKVAIHQNKY